MKWASLIPDWFPISIDSQYQLWVKIGDKAYPALWPGHCAEHLVCYAIGFLILGSAVVLGTTRWINSRSQ